jgi:uncharacterized membrane protein
MTNPVFTNDAVVFGILIVVLALIFYTSSLSTKFWKKFYTYIPALLLCYFVPALLHWPFGLISNEWYDTAAIIQHLHDQFNIVLPAHASLGDAWEAIKANNIDIKVFDGFKQHSQLYFVASRYLLPASLILLTLSIDFKGILNLGPKSLIMFFAGTLGVMLGGPIAILITVYLFPGMIPVSMDDMWRGMSTVAGSWIGGGANQTAMKEIFEVKDNIFASFIVVDVIVANIWMGFLLYGANIRTKIDKWLNADVSAIDDLVHRIENFRKKVEKIPTTTEVFIMLAVGFGGVALAHMGADIISPYMKSFKNTLENLRLNSLMSGFFWLIVLATTIGLLLSFTKAKKLEGIGASRWGSIFIYILVATIGMKMNLIEVRENVGLFIVGIIWMLVHVTTLLIVGKIIKAPLFFIAVGSQANIGGAASAPIVASAFNPSLAPVGVLLAVLGYAVGTYGAIITAYMMQWAAS